MTKQIPNVSTVFLYSLLLLIVTEIGNLYQFSSGAKRTIQVSDDLDDLVDDEEGEAWRELGRMKSRNSDFDPPPMDFTSELGESFLNSHEMDQTSKNWNN